MRPRSVPRPITWVNVNWLGRAGPRARRARTFAQLTRLRRDPKGPRVLAASVLQPAIDSTYAEQRQTKI